MPRMTLALAAVAAILGACGVMLAAASGHKGGDENARTGALFLILHAAAILGAVALARTVTPGVGLALSCGAAVLALGAALFSGDLAARAFLGGRLFPFAAPLGGSLMIFGWVALALICAVAALRVTP
jgi:uncharacterized membrane protein YgdD (TMEM256/DUF423 family)